MNIKLHTGMKIHNKYMFKLRDKHGKVKQEAKAENLVCNGAFGGMVWGKDWVLILGDSTTPPQASDTWVGNKVAKVSLGNATGSIVNMTDTQTKSTAKYTFPADSSNVYNVTEVGLKRGKGNESATSSNGYMMSHALLTDTEGNPITIEKTADETLEVEVILYFNYNAPEGTATEKGKFMSVLGKAADLVTYGNLNCAAYFTPNSFADLMSYAYAKSYCVENASSYSAFSTSTSGSEANKQIYLDNKEIVSSAMNNTYLNFLKLVDCFFRICDIMQPITLNDLPVGTGDGATVEFKKPLPAYIEGTEIIKKNGVALTRGTDYTIDHRSIRRRDCSVLSMCRLIDGYDFDKDPESLKGVLDTYTMPFLISGVDGKRPETYCQQAFVPGYPVVIDLTNVSNMYGKTINFIEFRGLTAGYGNSYQGNNEALYSPFNMTSRDTKAFLGLNIKIEKSDDSNAWTTLIDCTITTENINQVFKYDPSEGRKTNVGLPWPTFEFEDTTTNYLRISFDTSQVESGDWPVVAYYFTNNDYVHNPWNYAQQENTGNAPANYVPLEFPVTPWFNGLQIGYKGQEIIFTEAPADGDVLTMSAQVSSLYKTSDYKMYVTATMQF